jgi:hypothetical protein
MDKVTGRRHIATFINLNQSVAVRFTESRRALPSGRIIAFLFAMTMSAQLLLRKAL